MYSVLVPCAIYSLTLSLLYRVRNRVICRYRAAASSGATPFAASFTFSSTSFSGSGHLVKSLFHTLSGVSRTRGFVPAARSQDCPPTLRLANLRSHSCYHRKAN